MSRGKGKHSFQLGQHLDNIFSNKVNEELKDYYLGSQ